MSPENEEIHAVRAGVARNGGPNAESLLGSRTRRRSYEAGSVLAFQVCGRHCRPVKELAVAATPRTSIERILCPTDFSDTSRHALAHAAAIARWYEARLTMLYVFVNLPAVDVPPLVFEEVDRARLCAQMREFACIVPREVPVDCE